MTRRVCLEKDGMTDSDKRHENLLVESLQIELRHTSNDRTLYFSFSFKKQLPHEEIKDKEKKGGKKKTTSAGTEVVFHKVSLCCVKFDRRCS